MKCFLKYFFEIVEKRKMQVVEGLKTRIFSGFSGITSFFEKNIKIYKKGVDKWGMGWYSNKAVGESRGGDTES